MGKMSTEIATKSVTKIATRDDLVPPPRFKVIFMNDNVTTVDFVKAVLIEIYEHDDASATDLTYKIHEDGSAVVAILPFEIAESKAVETTLIARNNNFPLAVKIEPES